MAASKSPLRLMEGDLYRLDVLPTAKARVPGAEGIELNN